jgi:NADPH-dependent 2,4-dienoyl-CoA reductase/sulfur reductase-like enzyme
MMTPSDLVVIGAGPAGMAAAAEAAGLGLSVMLLDEQPRPGGQIYRAVDRADARMAGILGPDYMQGRSLTAGLSHPGITHVAGATVWGIDEGFRMSCSVAGRAVQLEGARLLLATGALERPMPLPGWTLPGVMTAGAAQILLKQSGVLAKRAVLVGSGPLLYLVAAQMLRAGTPPLALVETQGRGDLWRAARHMGGVLRAGGTLAKGLGLLAELRSGRVPRHLGATRISIEGEGRAEAVVFHAGGRRHRIACDTVLLHHGVVPNTQAARSMGIPHLWSDRQAAFLPVADSWGETPVAGAFIAGDGAGIGGAEVAEIAGRLAALKIAGDLGRLSQADRDARAEPLLRARAKALAIRPFLDRAYPPFAEALSPADGTIICRCEEVTAGQIRGYARLGCLGPNQAKAFGRAGMGPCQGRFCGLSVTALLAEANGRLPQDTGYQRVRQPLKPVTLGELAGMDLAEDAAGQDRT